MKNQISVEYLGTFGWILLVVMVTILSLSEFGIVDLSVELPEKCSFGDQIICKKQFLDENGNLVLTLESRLNKEIQISDVVIEGYAIDVANGCSSRTLKPRQEVNIICEVTDIYGSQQLFTENRKKLDITLQVTPKGTSESYFIQGAIITDIINADISDSFSCTALTGGSGDDVDFLWQCDGTILDSETYLGTGYCCDGNVIENPCTDSAADGGLDGACCHRDECNQLPIVNNQANQACEYQGGSRFYRCCSSCQEDVDPPPDLGG